jgi:hypothetical protein
MSATHSPLHNAVASKQVQLRPVYVPDSVWNHYFDPIDKEVYELLAAQFPLGHSAEELLVLLKQMDPDENSDYTLKDVWDALDISLKPFIKRKGKGFWVLKNEAVC